MESKRQFISFGLCAAIVMLLWLQFFAPDQAVNPPDQPINPPAQTLSKKDAETTGETSDTPEEPAPSSTTENTDPTPNPSEDQPELKLDSSELTSGSPEPALRDDLTLGSLDQSESNPFKIQVTLSNRGAAIKGIQLTEIMDENQDGPLQLIDPEISPETDSFLISLVSENKELTRLLAKKNWDWKVEKSLIGDEENDIATDILFTTTIDAWDGLQVSKRFRIHPNSYKIDLSIHWELPQEAPSREVSYRLQTANGLPLEGKWYALRFIEVVVESREGKNDRNTAKDVSNSINTNGEGPRWSEQDTYWVATDSQFFAAVTFRDQDAQDPWIDYSTATIVETDKTDVNWSDASYELTTRAFLLEPGNPATVQAYRIYAGPKSSDIWKESIPDVPLDSLMNYGWFGALSPYMLWLLKFFNSFGINWGLCILMLTVVVRSAMFPISRKQALSAQKMQALAPELKVLKEKHKNDAKKMQAAQMELWRKHKVNPLAGCLPMFLQLPIFIGLYWSLRLAFELRQASLIPGLWWCSDLSAPDRLFAFPAFIAAGLDSLSGLPLLGSLFSLGPYFNLLPIITVIIFLIQQKLFMPPPTDDQQAMQHKVMNFMMIFFGFLFYKVPSGLCLYFISSSLWGIAERKLLPRSSTAVPAPPAEPKRKKKKKTSTRS